MSKHNLQCLCTVAMVTIVGHVHLSVVFIGIILAHDLNMVLNGLLVSNILQ